MLETIFKKTRGFVLALMVLSLSAIFVLQFGGPQAQGCSQGVGQGYAAEIYGQKITVNQFRAAFALSGGDNVPPEIAKQYQMEEMVLRGLVERSLLAREAKRLGFSADPDDVMHKVAEDGLVHVSMSVDAGPFLPPSGARRYDFKDSKGTFSKDNLKKFIQYRLRRSVEEFANEQSEETLAQNMRDTIASVVTVSPEEVWSAYVREKETVTLEYARFSPVYYRDTLKPTTADIDAYITSHKDAVDAEYEREKHRYTALEKQVRASHILIKADETADEAAKAAAKDQAEKLLARARKGEDFAQLARTYSEDTGSAKSGGDLGYNPKGRMVTPFDEAQFALQPGQISDVVETTFGYHIIKVEGVREGDVPVDAAKRELAEKLYLDGKAAELAKAAAAAALEALNAGKTIEQLNAELALPAGATAGSAAPEPDALAPQFRDTRAFGRTDAPIAGPFDGSPLVRAAFEMTEDKPLPDAPMQLGEEWIVYKLKERVRANRSEVADTELSRVRDGLVAQKRRDAVTDYVRTLLQKAQDDKAVFYDPNALRLAAEGNT